MRLGLSLGLPSSGAAAIATLGLDFINASYEVNGSPVTLTDYVAITRTGTATYTASSGAVTDASASALRFDYTPNGGALRGLLIEKETTNLLARSEELANTPWASARMASTNNFATAPSGATTAARALCNTSSASGMFTRNPPSAFDGTEMTVTIFAKVVSGNWASFGFTDNGSNESRVFFNVSTGAIGSTTNAGTRYTITASSATNYGNGWYRLRVSATRPAGSAADQLIIYPACAGDGDLTVTSGVSEMLLWGAQLEVNPYASSYIRTTSAAVVRQKDSISMTGTDFSDWYNASEGTFVAEFETQQLGNDLFSANDTTANEAIRSTAGTASHLVVVDGGATQADIDAGTVSVNTVTKLAAAYKANDFASCINGGSVVTDTSGTVPTVTQLLLGQTVGSNNLLQGHLRKLVYYPRRLSNSQLQILTA